MADTDAFALQRSDLNGFLFADVGTEANGMPLSVLSMLARQGLDPWQEAGRMAKLPRAAALDGLARIIAALPSSPAMLPDAAAVAERLVALLPARGIGRATGPSMPSAQPTATAMEKFRQRAIAFALAAVIAGLLFYLAARLGAVPDSSPAAPQSVSPDRSEVVTP